MPSKSKTGDTGAVVSEDAIRQRAYYLWEADGRPEGRGDHYWHLAHQEATKQLVEKSANGVARVSKGKSPAAMPPAAKATKATRAKVKEGTAKAKAGKAEAAKPVKKAATKLRAAVPGK